MTAVRVLRSYLTNADGYISFYMRVTVPKNWARKSSCL